MQSTRAPIPAGPDRHPFDEDTLVHHVADGVFRGAFTDRWNALGGVVNGGYAVAVSLRALAARVPHPDPLVVSTFFLRRGVPGPVEIRTDVARLGRRTSTGAARLLQDGREVVRTTATFTDLADAGGDGTTGATRPTTTRLIAPAPQLPHPDEAIDPVGDTRLPGVTMTDQVEFRYPRLPGWRQGAPSGDPRAELWMRFTGGREADTLSLPLLVDGAAPAVLDLGVAGSATVELTTHVRARPAPGWLACRVTTRYVIGGYHEEDFEIWDSAGTLVAQARQLALVLGS